MADWTDIPDASLEVGKPARSIDVYALRDNPVAIAEGAVGAPRIQTAALQDEAVSEAKLVQSSSGTTYRMIYGMDGAAVALTGTTYTSKNNIAIFSCIRGGVVSLQFECSVLGGSGNTTITIATPKAGETNTLSVSANYPTFQTGSYSINVTPGEHIFIQLQNTTQATQSYIKNIRIYSDTEVPCVIPVYYKFGFDVVT